MARDWSPTLIDPIRRLIGGEGRSALNDAELLEKFITSADATAFEVLVWRHGGMVLGLCQRILRDRHEAEDAFQATFLVFARKASSIGQRDAVGCWLYKVAYRVALRLRSSVGKRPACGELPVDLPAPEAMDDADWRDLRPVLDDEIARLPEKYRSAFVLCYLEGRTNEQAAAQLGCPKGTVLSRLARGREWLRSRLARRGIVLSASAFALALSQNAVSAALPAAFTRTIVNAAVPFAAGKAANELVSSTIAALVDGVLRTMIITKVKIVSLALLSLCLVSAGVGWATTTRGVGDEPSASFATSARPATVTTAPRTSQSSANELPAANRLDGDFILNEDPVRRATTPAVPQERGGQRGEEPSHTGKVVAVAKDGKTFSIETPPQARGEEAGKLEIKLTDKTAIIYNDVITDGAKISEGYRAQVYLEKGSKETAATVIFYGGTAHRGPEITGEVLEVAQDGKSIIIGPLGPNDRGGTPKKETFPFDSKTVVVFSNVAAGQAKITQGYTAWLWLADDHKTVAKVQLIGTASESRRDEKSPDLGGKVAAVAPGGKKITVASQPGRRGEEPARQEITINDKTAVIYNNVSPDGTSPAEGFGVQVWLAEGSKDTASKVVFTGTPPERWTTVSGKVLEVTPGKDGFNITIEQPGAGRGEEPKRTKINIPATAKVNFFAVGPNEAKPAVGYDVHVRLKDDSKDTAAQATFFKAVLVPPRNGGRE